MMMQFELSPESILVTIFFLSKVWDWIKFYVNFTNNDTHQIENQVKASSRNSEDCNTDDNKSPMPMYDDDHSHVHGEETCYDNDRHCDDKKEEDESYFFSDSDSETCLLYTSDAADE